MTLVTTIKQNLILKIKFCKADFIGLQKRRKESILLPTFDIMIS